MREYHSAVYGMPRDVLAKAVQHKIVPDCSNCSNGEGCAGRAPGGVCSAWQPQEVSPNRDTEVKP